MHKSRSNYRDGYKAHLAVEPETGIITDVDLTPANAGDGPVGVALLDGEDDGLEVFADSAYGSGPVRAGLAERGHTAVIKPWPTARNPYLDDDQFRRDEFRIDYTARTVTCPNRHHRHHRHRKAPPRSGRAVWDVPCDPGAPPTTTAGCSTSANTTNCSPPPEPTGAPGSASTTTGNGGHSSNVPSPGSSPTATAECATAASNATGSASTSAPPSSTCAGSSTSASPTAPTAGPRHLRAGPGLTKRERHLRQSAIQRGRLSPSNIGSSVGHAPNPPPTLRRPADQRKRHLLSGLLAQQDPGGDRPQVPVPRDYSVSAYISSICDA